MKKTLHILSTSVCALLISMNISYACDLEFEGEEVNPSATFACEVKDKKIDREEELVKADSLGYVGLSSLLKGKAKLKNTGNKHKDSIGFPIVCKEFSIECNLTQPLENKS